MHSQSQLDQKTQLTECKFQWNLPPKTLLTPGTEMGRIVGNGCGKGMWLETAKDCCPAGTNGGVIHTCNVWAAVPAIEHIQF